MLMILHCRQSEVITVNIRTNSHRAYLVKHDLPVLLNVHVQWQVLLLQPGHVVVTPAVDLGHLVLGVGVQADYHRPCAASVALPLVHWSL